MADRKLPAERSMNALPRFIFMTRWLQVPLYLGLIVAQIVYVVQFWIERFWLVGAAMGMDSAAASRYSFGGCGSKDIRTSPSGPRT